MLVRSLQQSGGETMGTERSLKMLIAGAVRTGVIDTAALFTRETGIAADFDTGTALSVRDRVLAGQANADLVTMNMAGFDAAVAAGKIARDDIVLLGRVSVAVTVRNGAPEPDLSSVESFVAAILAADRLIHNQALTGLHAAEVFERLGIAGRVRDKTTVVPNGEAVMKALADDRHANTIAIAHATEIRLNDHLGTHLVGPLPGAIGRETPYGAATLAGAAMEKEARDLVALMGSPRGRDIFVASGVMPASA